MRKDSMMRRWTILRLAAVAALAGGTAWAQSRLAPDPTPRLPSQPGQGMPTEDARALQRAALFAEAQIEAGQLGARQGRSPELRRLGESIAADHARIRQDLSAIAGDRRLAMQDRAAAGVQDPGLDRLRQATPEAFDRAFLARQLGLYRPMAELFQTLASNSPDPVLQRFGIVALAAVRAHFEAARGLGEPMGLRVDTVEPPPQY
jgi:predicted outer membrane protein